MKKIAILGISGSIGISAIEVIRKHNDEFEIVLATAHKNKTKLLELSEEFQIKNIVLTGSDNGNKVDKTNLPLKTKIHYGKNSLLELLNDGNFDVVLNAVSGSAGLEYSMEIAKTGKILALANKESLVMAGHLLEKEIEKSGTQIIPVDSEHSALFQAIGASPSKYIRKLHLTASGGPFRDLPLEKFPDITLKQTLKHPTWNMGAKVTIDSATMMNKGLEIIEAHWLFKMPYDSIDAIIHKQSIVHSLVEYCDGSIIAQLSSPTMKLPILYSFTYPERLESDLIKTNIFDLQDLTFHKIEPARYPLFFLANQVGKDGGLLPTIMNSVNEAAISLFLEKKIHFVQIHKLVKNYLSSVKNISEPNLETILTANRINFEKALKDYKQYI